jgi:hypothetical protein
VAAVVTISNGLVHCPNCSRLFPQSRKNLTSSAHRAPLSKNTELQFYGQRSLVDSCGVLITQPQKRWRSPVAIGRRARDALHQPSSDRGWRLSDRSVERGAQVSPPMDRYGRVETSVWAETLEPPAAGTRMRMSLLIPAALQGTELQQHRSRAVSQSLWNTAYLRA